MLIRRKVPMLKLETTALILQMGKHCPSPPRQEVMAGEARVESLQPRTWQDTVANVKHFSSRHG